MWYWQHSARPATAAGRTSGATGEPDPGLEQVKGPERDGTRLWFGVGTKVLDTVEAGAKQGGVGTGNLKAKNQRRLHGCPVPYQKKIK